MPICAVCVPHANRWPLPFCQYVFFPLCFCRCRTVCPIKSALGLADAAGRNVAVAYRIECRVALIDGQRCHIVIDVVPAVRRRMFSRSIRLAPLCRAAARHNARLELTCSRMRCAFNKPKPLRFKSNHSESIFRRECFSMLHLACFHARTSKPAICAWPPASHETQSPPASSALSSRELNNKKTFKKIEAAREKFKWTAAANIRVH